MAYVVTGICVDCKYTSCVDACPVEAFHETPDRLYINPETCIDCNACVDECPITAIFEDYEVPVEQAEWIAKNTEAENYPVIFSSGDPLLGPKCVDPNAG